MPNIMGRNLMNNTKMRDEASRMAAEENILSCIKVSDKANATYKLDDFNRGMLWAVTLGSYSCDHKFAWINSVFLFTYLINSRLNRAVR